MIFRARFVVPVEGSPIENGAIAVQDGRITAVGLFRDVTKSGLGECSVRDFGDAVIVPGFVNAHTHLELSDLAGRLAPTCDFTAWLKSLFTILSAKERDEHAIISAVRTGIRQSLAAGVTTLGDITRYPAWSRRALSEAPVRVVSYGEVSAIGCRRNLLSERLLAATAQVQQPTERFHFGLSPHAPYTVEPAALRECLRAAQEADFPICMHLAETAEEEQFTLNLNGRFFDYLRDLGLWDADIQAYGCRPVEILDHFAFPTQRTLLAHVNYASDSDIESLARFGAAVAYCPRTHAAFGHPPHRFQDMLAAGVNVCLGTDSLASNPSLSVLEELQFLHAIFPQFAADELLQMATINGAQALGLKAICGSLAVGKSADFAVLSLQNANSQNRWTDIYEAGNKTEYTFIAGIAIS